MKDEGILIKDSNWRNIVVQIKKKNRNRHNLNTSLKWNSIVSGVCKPLSMIVSYIYVPIVLNYLGVEKYGVWSTILTILSWVSYFDIGIGNGLRNRLTESISEKRNDSDKLVSSAYAFISIIMICLIIAFSIAAYFIDWNSVLGVKKGLDENLREIVTISMIFVCLNFILSLCKNILYAYQKAGIVSLMELATQIFNLSGVLLFSNFIKASLFAMIIVYGCSMLMVNTGTSIVLYVKHQDVIPRLHEVNVSIGKDLTSLGIKFFVVQICALVLFTTDSLIISMIYGASDVTPYNTVNKLFTAVSNVYTALLAPIWSAVTKAKAEGNYSWLKKIIKRLNLLMIPFFACAIILAVIFRPLSAWWLQKNLFYSSGLIPLGCVYACLNIWCNTYSYISNGLELMRMSMITAIVQAVVNIPLSIVLAENFKMMSTGVLAGTVLSMCISAIVQPIAIRRCIKAKGKSS